MDLFAYSIFFRKQQEWLSICIKKLEARIVDCFLLPTPQILSVPGTVVLELSVSEQHVITVHSSNDLTLIFCGQYDVPIDTANAVNVFSVHPFYVEMVMPHLNAFLEYVSTPVNVVIAYPSLWPVREHAPWSEALIEMFTALRHAQSAGLIHLHVIDHEESLGQKNSARIRRIFLEHSN